MEQVIVGGFYNTLHTTITEYNALCGGNFWITTEGLREQLVSTDGVLKNLRIELNDVPGTGTYVFTVRLNGNPTALTCTVAADGTIASDTDPAHNVTITGGDRLSLECNPDNPDNARYAHWTVMFEGDTAKEGLIPGGTDYAVSVATAYNCVMGYGGGTNVEDLVRQIIPTAGVIKNLYVRLDDNPGGGDKSYTFTLRLNGADGLDGGNPLEVAIVGAATTGNDTTHEITVAAGDAVTIESSPANTPDSPRYAVWGMTFVADTDGESIIMASGEDSMHNSTTEYNYLIFPSRSVRFDWTATESEHFQLIQACTLKKLYILLSASPGSGNSYTFTLRVTDTTDTMKDGNLTVTIADTETTGNDTANTDVLLDGQTVAMKVVPFSNPNTAKPYWGLVSYIEPPPVGWAGGDVLGVDIGTVAKINGVLLADITKVNGVA